MMKYAIIIAVLVLLSSHSVAQGLPSDRHILISGRGYVEEMPDYIEMYLSISKTSNTLKESKAYVDKITQQILDAAIANHIAAGDITASKIYARPDYKWIDSEHKYLGEKVSRTVTLRQRNLSQYGQLVEAIIDAEVTEIDGVQLLFDDRSIYEQEAMKVAIADAKKKAQVIASQFEAKVGSVYKISETAIDDRVYSRPMQMMAEMPSPGGPVDFKIAKQRVNESVYVVFLLTN